MSLAVLLILFVGARSPIAIPMPDKDICMREAIGIAAVDSEQPPFLKKISYIRCINRSTDAQP